MTSLPPQVQQFLSENSLAIIATISNDSDYPYVLPVFYTTDDSAQLYFTSHKDSKKMQNIISHPHIGIAITDTTNLKSLQLQGTATLGEPNAEIIEKILNAASENSETTMPPVMKIKDGSMGLIIVKIHWYRLANYSGKEAEFIEGIFD